MIDESRYTASMLYSQTTNLGDGGIVKLDSLKNHGENNTCKLDNFEIILESDCRFRLRFNGYPNLSFYGSSKNDGMFAIIQFYSELEKKYVGKGLYVEPVCCSKTLMSELCCPSGPDGLYSAFGKKGDKFTLRIREQRNLNSIYPSSVFIETFEEF